jgi:hypothetical protein
MPEAEMEAHQQQEGKVQGGNTSMTTYAEIRHMIYPGDVIAFGGKGRVSRWIKWLTWSRVSHVGIVGESKHNGRWQLIESTTLNDEGVSGVQEVDLERRIEAYNGQVWLLKLAPVHFYYSEFEKFISEHIGKEYDYEQAIGSGFIIRNEKCFKKFFCSELVAGALEAAKVIPITNVSEATPKDVISWNIYAPKYYQLKGKRKRLPRYNTKEIR